MSCLDWGVPRDPLTLIALWNICVRQKVLFCIFHFQICKSFPTGVILVDSNKLLLYSGGFISFPHSNQICCHQNATNRMQPMQVKKGTGGYEQPDKSYSLAPLVNQPTVKKKAQKKKKKNCEIFWIG